MKEVLVLLILLILAASPRAQVFVNPDLEGEISGTSVPNGWSNVPYTDQNCEASELWIDSPDIVGDSGPNIWFGIFGSPYSESSFVSGLYGDLGIDRWHEGIMQTVSGLSPGLNYQITFYQSVVKQANALDSSGSWLVFMDTVLIDTTAPTISLIPYDSGNLHWEKRQVVFTAIDSTHLFKFLPIDDDTNLNFWENQGALRMGIDSISLSLGCNIDVQIGNDTAICAGDSIILNAGIADAFFVWQDGSDDSVMVVKSQGEYWVHAKRGQCSISDTIQVSINPLPNVDLGSDINICDDELQNGVSISGPGSMQSYAWNTGDTGTSIVVMNYGTYRLTVTDTRGCMNTDTIEVQNCLHISESDGDERYNLYPNPNDGEFILSIQGKGNIEIYDVTSNQVFTSEIDNEKSIDLSDMGSGLYFFSISAQDRITNGRFLIR